MHSAFDPRHRSVGNKGIYDFSGDETGEPIPTPILLEAGDA